MTTRSHDHEILVGSSTYRLNLIRDDDGKAMYSVTEDVPEYSPQFEFEQTNWVNGHGRYWFDDTDAYFEGQSIDTTQEGRVILGPLINEVYESDDTELDSAPVCFRWFAAQGKWLCATSGKIYIYGTKWTAATTTVAGVTDLKEFKGIMYAACGASKKYYYSSDGDTWTQTDLTDGYANKLLAAYNADGTAVTLWKFKTPNELSSTTDGRTVAGGGSQWSSAAYIGDTSADITNIFLLGGNLMIGREDNLYNYDSTGGIHPLQDELKLAQSTSNFKYVANWQSALYFSRGTGLGELSGNSAFAPVGPLEDTIDIGKVGTCVGLSSDPDYLYIAMDEGTNSHIYKSREVRTKQGLRWQHCPWVYLGTNACATIEVCQHSATDRRLWFGYGTHTAYVIITDNPTTDSAARFAASGWLRMSYTFGHNLYWDKLFNRLITDTKGCASGKTVTVKYRKDTDTTATSFASAITTNGVVETDATSLVACKKIQFEVWLATNASTVTPEVLMFKATGTEKPEAVRVHECVYTVGDTPNDRAETLRSALRAARTSVALIRLADLRYGEYIAGTSGTDYAYVICQPGFPQEVEVVHEKGRAPELGIKVKWQEVGNTVTDDWGYDYGKLEDIIQDVYDSTNSMLRISVI